MNETEKEHQLEQFLFEQDILAFANRYSLERLKISTYNYDLDYQRQKDGSFLLKSRKAVVRALGKVTKVPIGEEHQYQTFEEAFEATKKYWQEYYRRVRANRSDKEKRAEAARQKRYRERQRLARQELKQRS